MITIEIWQLLAIGGIGYALGFLLHAAEFWRMSRLAERAIELADKAFAVAMGEDEEDETPEDTRK